MVRRICTILLIAVVMALTACAGSAKRNAALYETARAADVREAQAQAARDAQAQEARTAERTALAAKCQTDECVSRLSTDGVLTEAIAALKAQAAPRTQQTPVPYERDGAAKARDLLSGVTPLVLGVASEARNVKISEHGRDTALAREQTTQTVVRESVAATSAAAQSASAATATVATSAIEHAQPNITVGGAYVSGTQHIGDTITGDGNATHGGQNGHDVESGAVVEASTGVALEQGAGAQQIEQGDGDLIVDSPPTTTTTTTTTTTDNSDDGDDCKPGGAGCDFSQPVEPEEDAPLLGPQ